VVEDEQGRRHRCVTRRQVERPVTGDRVLWIPGAGRRGVVIALEPRRSLLARPDPHLGTRPVVANLDLVAVVVAPEPECPAALVDRYLVAAAAFGLETLLLVNKADRIGSPGGQALETAVAAFAALGQEVLRVSAATGAGIPELGALLRGHASALVGPSGVGKSSLVRSLIPGAEAAVGALSDATGHGRHTTSGSTLFHLPGGGDLIDSPGVRDFGLWHLTPAAVLAGFPEIAALAAHCRFRDCAHRGEPGCAVEKALAEGRLDPRRVASYRAIVAGIEGAH
jgi:ribosome biogenesis GTPase